MPWKEVGSGSEGSMGRGKDAGSMGAKSIWACVWGLGDGSWNGVDLSS